jgi:MFS family permease
MKRGRVVDEAAVPGGGAWVIALLSGPLLGWIAGSTIAAGWTEGSWRWRSLAWIALGFALPVGAALRHGALLARGKRPVAGVVVLTLIAAAFSLPAWRHLFEGPTSDQVLVTAVKCHLYGGRKRVGQCIVSEVVLEGRTFLADVSVTRGLTAPAKVKIVRLDDWCSACGDVRAVARVPEGELTPRD